MKYSILTINYNNREGLARTIRSVLAQTCTDYEFLIIDGGSTDGSVDVIRAHADRLAYWVSEPDGGIFPAMNKATAHAQGEYCIYMNSGDCFFDCNSLLRLAEAGDEDIVVGRVYTTEGKEFLYQPAALTMYFLYSSTIPHQGAAIRTSLVKKYPYDEKLRYTADWKFFMEAVIFANCSVRFIDAAVARFDTSGISTSNPTPVWEEKLSVMRGMFPPRVMDDFRRMKDSECLTQQLAPALRTHYSVDRLLYRLGRLLLRFKGGHAG